MTDLPPDITYGHVTARLLLAVADSPDSGRMPDARPASGTVTFTPKTKILKVSTPEPATILPQTITCTLDDAGNLIDDQQAAGVWLVAGQYQVAYKLTGAALPSHDIDVTTAHTADDPLDLTLALPPAGPPLSPSQYAELSARIDALVIGVVPETAWAPVPLLDGWTGTAQVRRFGPVVSLTVQALNGTAATSVNVLDLPSGFRPARGAPVFEDSHKTGSTSGLTNGNLALSGGSDNRTLRASVRAEWTNGNGTLTFLTDDPMPA